jgi:hypothetical protein
MDEATNHTGRDVGARSRRDRQAESHAFGEVGCLRTTTDTQQQLVVSEWSDIGSNTCRHLGINMALRATIGIDVKIIGTDVNTTSSTSRRRSATQRGLGPRIMNEDRVD